MVMLVIDVQYKRFDLPVLILPDQALLRAGIIERDKMNGCGPMLLQCQRQCGGLASPILPYRHVRRLQTDSRLARFF